MNPVSTPSAFGRRGPVQTEQTRLTLGDLEIDLLGREVRRAGRRLALTDVQRLGDDLLLVAEPVPTRPDERTH